MSPALCSRGLMMICSAVYRFLAILPPFSSPVETINSNLSTGPFWGGRSMLRLVAVCKNSLRVIFIPHRKTRALVSHDSQRACGSQEIFLPAQRFGHLSMRPWLPRSRLPLKQPASQNLVLPWHRNPGDSPGDAISLKRIGIL